MTLARLGSRFGWSPDDLLDLSEDDMIFWVDAANEASKGDKGS